MSTEKVVSGFVMCGRFALFISGEELAKRFQLAEPPLFDPRYNIAPTQAIAEMRATADGNELAFLRWGLIPSWASDSATGNKLLHARIETVAQKPSFRSAFRQRRCLIPASGYYEWQKTGADRKQPYFIHPCDGGLFVLASLWERWQDPQGDAVETCTIVTTKTNELMRPLHEHMPVILDLTSEAVWLDPRASAEALRTLPCLSPVIECKPSPWVLG